MPQLTLEIPTGDYQFEAIVEGYQECKMETSRLSSCAGQEGWVLVLKRQ